MIKSYFNAVADKVEKCLGFDGYNEPQLVTVDENIPCRYIGRSRVVSRGDGDQVVSSGEVWFPGEFVELPPQSRVSIFGERKTVIESKYVVGIFKNFYLKVFLQ